MDTLWIDIRYLHNGELWDKKEYSKALGWTKEAVLLVPQDDGCNPS